MRAPILVCLLSVALASAKESTKSSKYSKEANTVKDLPKAEPAFGNDSRPPKNYATTTERLFQMQKIQNIWQKGQSALNANKLKALYHDLKAQDKQEIAFKKIKSQGKDTDGLQEAALRTQLSGIVERYALQSSFPEHQKQPADEEQFQRLFKSKKLNKLWNKIENSGLDEVEMKILKEELSHHQEKLDQYYAFVDNLDEERVKTREDENSLSHFLDDEVESDKKGTPKASDNKAKKQADEQRGKELDDQYKKLATRVRDKLNDREFTDFHAKKLWNLAQVADFDAVELSSLREELHHFEHRAKKLHHLNNELENKENPDAVKIMTSKVREYEKKVENMRDDLHNKIRRRTEL